MSKVTIPDIGGATDVEVIEVLVSEGDSVSDGDSLITLESDKASMDVPTSQAGKITKILVKVGDKVNEGDAIVELDAQDDSASKSDSSKGKSTKEDSKKDDKEAQEKAQPSDNKSSSKASGETKAEPSSGSSESAEKFSGKLVVIGAGPGGYTAAFRAADLGLDVTLIERYSALGGVCLNVGCIPSKALLHSAAVISQARELQQHGIDFGKPSIDVDKLRHFKESVVGKLTGGLASMAKARGVKVIQGVATFKDTNTLDVQSEKGSQEVGFDRAIIAAGSRVTTLPAFEIDDQRVIDSTGALELESIPKTMLIIGGGIIGLEMATVYSELGCEVSIVEFLPQIIAGADKDLVAPLEKRMKSLVKSIMTSTKVTKLEANKKGIKVSFENVKDGSSLDAITYEKVLVATGRIPNTDKLNIESANINVNDHGFIEVDHQMRTSQDHIFAIGDIVGQPMLAHKATHEAKVAAEVCAGLKSAFEARVIPSVAYTDPEIAWVGLTETQAKQENIEYEKAVFPWAASGRAIGNDRTEGKTKLLVDPATHRVLGGGIVGTQAGDLIAEVALAIEMGSDVSDIGLTIHAHPTLSETVAMAAEVYEGTITDLYIPKKKA